MLSFVGMTPSAMTPRPFPYTTLFRSLNLNGSYWSGGGNLHALVPSTSTAVFYIYNRSDKHNSELQSPFLVVCQLGLDQNVVFVNESGATLTLFAEGQGVWPARLVCAG